MDDTNTTDATIEQAARELTEVEDELREAHGEPVAELPSMRVYADEHGHEHGEIAEHHNDQHGTDLTRAEISEWMHEQARGVDHSWGVSDPVVVLED